MIHVLSGRIETATAQTIDEMGGKKRSRFVFSDLEQLDPEGRYKVIIHDWLPRGVPVPVQVSGVVQSVRFHLQSFQRRFAVQKLDGETLFQSVFLAKADLLKKRAKGKDPEFDLLVDLLYKGPEQNLSAASKRALKELSQYSEWAKKTVRLSAKRFGLQKSLTIQGSWVAIDIKKTLKIGKTKVKMALLPDGREIVRRINEPTLRLVNTLASFRDTPHVMPTLATARYVNSKGRDVFVSYHPFFRQNLVQFLGDGRPLSYRLRIKIVGQILTGVEAIHKKGTHRNLHLRKMFISKEQEILVAGLEKFVPHGELGEPIKAAWSAPETLNTETPPPPDEKQDVWQLGTIFAALFKKKIDRITYFPQSPQEEIDDHIREEGFPPPIAVMIQGMLQVDPTKRWSTRQVIDHFRQEVVEEFGRFLDVLRESPISTSALVDLQTYAKKYEQAIRFSAGYFQLKHSATATADLVAVDIKKKLKDPNNAKTKLALLPDGTKIVRRIIEYDPRCVKIFNLFRNVPHVLPTLGMARYTNKKGEDVLVSYHPLFDADLFDPLIKADQSLKHETQVDICHQIILGVEEIHKKGIHGDLYLKNIFISVDIPRHVVIADLEEFSSHDGSVEERILPEQADWKPPEVRNAEDRPPAATSHDIWSLGLIFHALFQKENRIYRFFQGCTQDEIFADIETRNFPPPVAQMIRWMLQIDPTKRWTLKEVGQHFRQEILFFSLAEKSETASEKSNDVASITDDPQSVV